MCVFATHPTLTPRHGTDVKISDPPTLGLAPSGHVRRERSHAPQEEQVDLEEQQVRPRPSHLPCRSHEGNDGQGGRVAGTSPIYMTACLGTLRPRSRGGREVTAAISARISPADLVAGARVCRRRSCGRREARASPRRRSRRARTRRRRWRWRRRVLIKKPSCGPAAFCEPQTDASPAPRDARAV